MSDIRIYIQGIGEISREQSVTYVATGMVPEDALLASLPEKAVAWYQDASPAEQERNRRNYGAVRIGDFEDGKPKFSSEVELYLPVKHSWGDEPAHISTGGTSRSVDEAAAYAEALTLAVSIARQAEALTATS